MPDVLFEQHLAQRFKPLCEDTTSSVGTKTIRDLLTKLATIANPQTELSDSMELLAVSEKLSPNDVALLETTLLQATARQFDITEEDNLSESDVRSFLALLNKPFGKADTSTTVDDMDGYRPHKDETGARAFLRQLKIARHPEPYGNDFLGGVKQFNRHGKNNFGHDQIDYDFASARGQLSNPILNVDADKQYEAVFSAEDSQGMGFRHQYRLLNRVTNQWCSPQMNKEDCEAAAAELNGEMAQLIADQNKIVTESIINQNQQGQGYDVEHESHPLHSTCVKHGWHYSHSTPIHQKNGNILIHQTWQHPKHPEHKIGSYKDTEQWESKTSPSSGKSTTGEGVAAIESHLKGESITAQTEQGRSCRDQFARGSERPLQDCWLCVLLLKK